MFNFFGLPLELRDLIYDAMERNAVGRPSNPVNKHWKIYLHKTGASQSPTPCQTIGIPKTSHLLVNSQFQRECCKRAMENLTLTLQNRSGSLSDLPRFITGPPFKYVPDLIMRLAIVQQIYDPRQRDLQWRDVRTQVGWVSHFAGLRQCTIDIHLPNEIIDEQQLLNRLGQLPLPTVPTTISVYRSTVKLTRAVMEWHHARGWDYDAYGPLLAKWKTEGGVMLENPSQTRTVLPWKTAWEALLEVDGRSKKAAD